MPELANHSANSWLFPASPTTGRASCSDKTALGQLSFGRLACSLFAYLPCHADEATSLDMSLHHAAGLECSLHHN